MNDCVEEKISMTKCVNVTLSVLPDVSMTTSTKKEDLFFFEGVEKILEIYFESKDGDKRDLREIRRDVWDKILHAGKCAILVKDSNSYCDTYILSESSLFVYPNKIIIKTCGKTTPLSCLPILESHARKEHGLTIRGLGFHRKNYSFPKEQIDCHRSFKDEVCAIRRLFPKFQDQSHVLGSLDSEHWVTHNAGVTMNDDDDVVMHLLCYDMEKNTSMFFKSEKNTAESVTRCLELEKMICGNDDENRGDDDVVIHAHMFEPCGYSMNGLNGSNYVTVHVTPESHCSYASFETNCTKTPHNVLMTEILRKLRPKRFTVVLHGNNTTMSSSDPTKLKDVIVDKIDHYARRSHDVAILSSSQSVCSVSHFSRTPPSC